MLSFSEALEGISMSPIVTISEEAAHKADIHLQRGEMDADTPTFIKTACTYALTKNMTKYPKTGGEKFFREAVLQYLKETYDIHDLEPHNIITTYGGQEGLELAFQLFHGSTGAGFAPVWTCLLENMIPYARVNFRQVPLNDDLSVDFEELERSTRARQFFYINNPHNPTGKVFTKEELLRIVEICTRNRCYIISDEAYEHFVYDGEHFSLAQIEQDNIITCFTFSKSYAMTGWRIGYVVTRHDHIAELLRFGNYAQTAGVPAFIQYAASKALEYRDASDEFIRAQRERLAARRDVLYDGLSSIDGIILPPKPKGAFYLFPNFRNFVPGNLYRTGYEPERANYIYQKLLDNGIASVYGLCFGDRYIDYVRFSYSSVGVDKLYEAVERMREIFKSTLYYDSEPR